MGKKIITHEESDEDFILGSLMKGNRPELEQPIPTSKKVDAKEEPDEPLKEEPKKKKAKAVDYQSIFVKESEEISRTGKTMNIRPEFHERIVLIIQMIGENKVSLFSYIDNVLKLHLDTYETEIDDLLEEKLKRKMPSKKR